jgi:hypothetical protein
MLKANVPLTRKKRNTAGLRALVKKSVPLKKKKTILQKGGFLGSLLAPIVSVVAPLLSTIYLTMKPLELMNQGGQLSRPKPPIEQRVKVMDTLDKKMQTILDREDIPTDQRLKLYDQSLYRYLDVFDGYRPKPEVSTPTPELESLDPIESEILDSVPKTMRGKADFY